MAISKQKVVAQIDDAMRVVGNIKADTTNFINSNRIIDGNGQVVTPVHFIESLELSTQIVQDAFKQARAFLKDIPFDEVI
jgi:hypothetical protein